MAIEWQEWDGDFTKCQHIMDAYIEAYGGNGNTKNMSADEDFSGLLRFYQNQKWTRDEDMMYTILPQKNLFPESYLLFVAKAYAELATYALHEAETVWPIFYDICYEHESKKSLRIRR